MPAPPQDTYLVMQHEAAKRYASMNQEYLFSVQTRPWFTYRIVHSFKESDVRPEPGVRTVLLRINQIAKPVMPLTERKKYIRFVTAGITGKTGSVRKNLQDVVTQKQWKRFIAEHELESDISPLELEVKQWVALYQATRPKGPVAPLPTKTKPSKSTQKRSSAKATAKRKRKGL